MTWNPEYYAKNSDAQLKWAGELRKTFIYMQMLVQPWKDKDSFRSSAW